VTALQGILAQTSQPKRFCRASPEHVHYFLEAKKLAFEDRAKFYADPEFNQIPVEQLISMDYAAERRRLIRSDKAAKTYDAGKPELDEGDEAG